MYACVWLFHIAELTLLIYIHGPAIVLQSTRPTSQNANWKRLNARELSQLRFMAKSVRLSKAEFRYGDGEGLGVSHANFGAHSAFNT